MPRATDCMLASRPVSIEVALQLRDAAKKQNQVLPDFRCIECGNRVRPHKKSEQQAAHFEHRERIMKCSRSDASDRH